MLRYLGVLVCMMLSLHLVSAESVKSQETKYKDVVDYSFDLTLEELGNGKVAVSWDAFDKDLEFKWYKLLHSTSNENPVYPDQGAAFVGMNSGDNSTYLWLKSGKTNYVRICAITQEGEQIGRYCSNTQKFNITQVEKDEGAEIKAHYAKKQVQAKEVSKKDVVKNNSELSDAVKARIDILLEDFIVRLEGRNYSDAKMITAIDGVIEKLTAYQNNARYASMVNYMIEVLEEYRAKYNDLDIFEDLLNEF